MGIRYVSMTLLLLDLHFFFMKKEKSIQFKVVNYSSYLLNCCFLDIGRKWSQNQKGSILQCRPDRAKDRKPMRSQAWSCNREDVRRCSPGYFSETSDHESGAHPRIT